MAAMFLIYVAMENGIGIWSAEYAKRIANGITGMTTRAPMFFLCWAHTRARLRARCITAAVGKKSSAWRPGPGGSRNGIADRIRSLSVALAAVFLAGLGCASVYPHLYCVAIEVVWRARKARRRHPLCLCIARRSHGAVARRICLKAFGKFTCGTAGAADLRADHDWPGFPAAPADGGLRYS